ncbi:MAG: 50S ribosomal protein L25/general stress protein Ctc [Methylococcaceae bacterium]|nr:50S ribosomal protein L25/general stress protein Ctc [Methylococcaceae bacterium]MCI0668011.1 50S ribosomal protein L25/general stress protein Ctc [Methylococcaceae bacterium]MCI0733193.1 50S ribosomal protein L25/general stress protein Ctc [Methylococcaceae bacterium]
MTGSFVFNAESRSRTGSRAARALRRADRIPGVVYGGHEEPVYFSLVRNEVVKNLENEGVYSHILTLNIDGKPENTVLKDLHRHPSKSTILHMDFQRISKAEKIRVHIPLHFIGESVSVGVKKGGVVTHNFVDAEVSCLPDDLPEFIEVDLSRVDLGQSVHLSDLRVAPGVELYALAHGGEQDLVVASVQSGRISDSVEPAVEGAESTLSGNQ